MQKPFSQACENNKRPILAVLQQYLDSSKPWRVFEIGSGTGQHAVFFGSEMRHISWQPSDLAANLPGIEQWLREAALGNVLSPRELDIDLATNVSFETDAIYTANTWHIMGWSSVQRCIAWCAEQLPESGLLFSYGPFRYNGDYTSQSNAQFDLWLKQCNPASGIRDFEAIAEEAAQQGIHVLADHAMPANNQLIVWQKQA